MMTKPSEELAIERVAVVVTHLEAEVAKEEPEAGSAQAIVREQQKRSLEMWRGVLNKLMLPSQEDARRLVEEKESIFRKYTNTHLVMTALQAEIAAMRFYFDRLHEAELKADYEYSIARERTEHDRGVCNGLKMALHILAGTSYVGKLIPKE